ncbi:MAG: hypothetical protein WCQ99_09950 [Pseudomonadota bacterium]
MKINKNKVQHLIKEYSIKAKKVKVLDDDNRQEGVTISTDSKKKIVFKKTLDDLCEKLVKKSNMDKK